jgi:hypothetical protein
MNHRKLVATVHDVFSKDGRPLIPAFTVQYVWDDDEQFTYWIVNLHDVVVAEMKQFNIKLFHDRTAAEAFAAEQRGKPH